MAGKAASVIELVTPCRDVGDASTLARALGVHTMTIPMFEECGAKEMTGTITVRHIVEGHAYEWYVIDDPSAPDLVSIANVWSNTKATSVASKWLEKAREFAEVIALQRKKRREAHPL